MSRCWPEGELRAYLDRELTARDMEWVAEHVKQCEACRLACEELAGRADRVTAWLQVLPEPQTPVKIPVIPSRAGRAGRWLAVGGLAAALAATLVTTRWTPRVGSKPVEVKRAPLLKAKVAPDAPLPDGRGSDASIPSRDRKGAVAVRRAVPPKRKPRVEDYVALDDEPIESGVVIRVGFSGGRVPADVIFGPDGRARAIRLVSDILGEQ
jgi:hypothetical protein